MFRVHRVVQVQPARQVRLVLQVLPDLREFKAHQDRLVRLALSVQLEPQARLVLSALPVLQVSPEPQVSKELPVRQARLVLLEQRVLPDLAAFKAHQVRQDLLALLVRPDLPEQQVSPEPQVFREHPVRPEVLDLLVRPEQPASLELQEFKGRREALVQLDPLVQLEPQEAQDLSALLARPE